MLNNIIIVVVLVLCGCAIRAAAAAQDPSQQPSVSWSYKLVGNIGSGSGSTPGDSLALLSSPMIFCSCTPCGNLLALTTDGVLNISNPFSLSAAEENGGGGGNASNAFGRKVTSIPIASLSPASAAFVSVPQQASVFAYVTPSAQNNGKNDTALLVGLPGRNAKIDVKPLGIAAWYSSALAAASESPRARWTLLALTKTTTSADAVIPVCINASSGNSFPLQNTKEEGKTAFPMDDIADTSALVFSSPHEVFISGKKSVFAVTLDAAEVCKIAPGGVGRSFGTLSASPPVRHSRPLVFRKPLPSSKQVVVFAGGGPLVFALEATSGSAQLGERAWSYFSYADSRNFINPSGGFNKKDGIVFALSVSSSRRCVVALDVWAKAASGSLVWFVDDKTSSSSNSNNNNYNNGEVCSPRFAAVASVSAAPVYSQGRVYVVLAAGGLAVLDARTGEILTETVSTRSDGGSEQQQQQPAVLTMASIQQEQQDAVVAGSASNAATLFFATRDTLFGRVPAEKLPTPATTAAPPTTTPVPTAATVSPTTAVDTTTPVPPTSTPAPTTTKDAAVKITPSPQETPSPSPPKPTTAAPTTPAPPTDEDVTTMTPSPPSPLPPTPAPVVEEKTTKKPLATTLAPRAVETKRPVVATTSAPITTATTLSGSPPTTAGDGDRGGTTSMFKYIFIMFLIICAALCYKFREELPGIVANLWEAVKQRLDDANSNKHSNDQTDGGDNVPSIHVAGSQQQQGVIKTGGGTSFVDDEDDEMNQIHAGAAATHGGDDEYHQDKRPLVAPAVVQLASAKPASRAASATNNNNNNDAAVAGGEQSTTSAAASPSAGNNKLPGGKGFKRRDSTENLAASGAARGLGGVGRSVGFGGRSGATAAVATVGGRKPFAPTVVASAVLDDPIDLSLPAAKRSAQFAGAPTATPAPPSNSAPATTAAATGSAAGNSGTDSKKGWAWEDEDW